MIEVFEWISTGGCEACDSLAGYHFFEPERPHPHCKCDIEPTELGMRDILDFADDILDFVDEDELEDALEDLDDDLVLASLGGAGVGAEGPSVEDIKEALEGFGDGRPGDDCPVEVEMKFVDSNEITDSSGKVVELDVIAVATLICLENQREHDFTFEMTVPVNPNRIREFDQDLSEAWEQAERLVQFGAPLDPPPPSDFCTSRGQP